MFGIGLPELIIIMAVALIVVGPEKLPELAKSLAKGVMELKKTASALKDSLHENEEDTKKAWERIEPEEYPPLTQINESPAGPKEEDAPASKSTDTANNTAQIETPAEQPDGEEGPKDT